MEHLKQPDRTEHSLLTRNIELPAWLWLWLPLGSFSLALVVIPLCKHLCNPDLFWRLFAREGGVVEWLTVVFLLGAIWYGYVVLTQGRRGQPSFLNGWIALVVLGCLYFVGEEVSWGQHIFGWATPSWFETLNRQGETNLHNVSPVFDQYPRLVLQLFTIIGGIVIPLRREFACDPTVASGWSQVFWPTVACIPAACAATVVQLPMWVERYEIASLPYPFSFRLGELQECFFALFLLIYLASIFHRSRPLQTSVSP